MAPRSMAVDGALAHGAGDDTQLREPLMQHLGFRFALVPPSFEEQIDHQSVGALGDGGKRNARAIAVPVSQSAFAINEN